MDQPSKLTMPMHRYSAVAPAITNSSGAFNCFHWPGTGLRHGKLPLEGPSHNWPSALFPSNFRVREGHAPNTASLTRSASHDAPGIACSDDYQSHFLPAFSHQFTVAARCLWTWYTCRVVFVSWISHLFSFQSRITADVIAIARMTFSAWWDHFRRLFALSFWWNHQVRLCKHSCLDYSPECNVDWFSCSVD